MYEPNYESGRAVRWGIKHMDGRPFAIAGIYREWSAPEGKKLWSFAMLTINADGHPVFERMHKPGEERRMVVILDDGEQERWLICPVAEAPSFFKQWQAR